jgi:FAD/FMN-containing dehydrogenase/Fe-S oxidoreductase
MAATVPQPAETVSPARSPNGQPSGQPNGRADRAAVETARILQAELKQRVAGEVRFDRAARMLYSTDASNYQIEPIGVVLPKTTEDVLATVELAASHGVPLLPRGGGSALAGQTVGAALIVDFSKYLNRVLAVDPEAKTVTVEPGINLDSLNRLLKPNGLMFGPDPSSGNRATIGGVVGNNATGAHSILYGMTSDNVRAIKAVRYGGGVVELGPGTREEQAARARHPDETGRLLAALLPFGEQHADLIRRDFPPHWRRATGYSLDQFVKPDDAFNPARLLVASEGSLATTLEVTLDLHPTPQRTGLVMLQFAELVAAMAATPVILESEPSAIELMDRMLINLTRSQPGYARQISLIHGDPAGVLVVEFYGADDRELNAKAERLERLLAERYIPLVAEPLRVLDPELQADVWSVRKAGLGLLMSVKGDHKPIPVIEDVSVPVEHLAEYVGAIEQLVAGYGTTAAFYAHASAGCLHIRPLVNLKTLAGVTAMKEMALAAAELAHRFGGVMSGEHGDGLQRSELNPAIFGPELYGAMRQFKAIWDPRGLMNPGKKVDGPDMTEHLRFGPAYHPREPKTFLDFSEEGGFLRALEMCNGAAVCRKLQAGTMCPSYMATKDEADTTRGRANALRNALAGRVFDPSEFTSKEVYDTLDLCLSCKACKTECPSSVDLAKIKTEWLAHYHRDHGTPLRTRVFGNIHQMSKLAAPVAPLANLVMKSPLAKPGKAVLGIAPQRSLPDFAARPFDARWKAYQKTLANGHSHSNGAGVAKRETRGQVVYFHDTFATYNYPKIAVAAVRLLEAAGFEVIVEERRACCGRPMLSKGLVEEARKLAKVNVAVLAPYAHRGIPIVGTEPSCILTLRDEYKDLLPGDAGVLALAGQAFMLDEFLAKLDKDGDLGIGWTAEPGPEVLFHGHCHQKALIGIGPSMAILKTAGCAARESGAGCCGMAGSFGYEAEHYDVSKKIGEDRLFPAVNAASQQTVVSVAGVSCRQQIEHFTDRSTRHIAEVLADRIAPGHHWQVKPGVATDPDGIPADVRPTPEAEAHAKNTGAGPA